MLLRLVIGGLGVCLPWLLILGDRVLEGEWRIRDSVSAYYYSGTRDGFVATMFVIGVFLITYRFFERKSLENILSVVAGLAGVLVGWFPTSRRDEAVVLTPLQDKVGEFAARNIHYGAAIVFIGLLVVMSLMFGWQEGRLARRPGARRSPAFWRYFHHGCAAVIVVGVVTIPLWDAWGSDVALWIGEMVAVEAYGVSWLAKGAEWDVLFGRRVTPRTRSVAAV
jgi:hypothetical protein